MSSLDEVFKASDEFKVWYDANLATRVEKFNATDQHVAEWAAFYGWMGARGLDLDAALAEEIARVRAGNEALAEETARLKADR